MLPRPLFAILLVQALLSVFSEGLSIPQHHDEGVVWGEDYGHSAYFLLGQGHRSGPAFITSVDTTLRIPNAPALRSDGAYGIFPGLQNDGDDIVQSMVAILPRSNMYIN